MEIAGAARPTPTSTPTCSRCSRGSRSRRTSATWRRPINDEIARVAKEGVDDKTLAEVALAREVRVRRPALHRRQDGQHRVLVHRPHRRPGSINAYFALYDKVTSADVKRVAASYFTPPNRTVVTLKAAKSSHEARHAALPRAAVLPFAAAAAAASPPPAAKPPPGRRQGTAKTPTKVGRHPHRLPPLARQPAVRDPPLLPGRLRRRSEGEGRAGRAHRRDGGQGGSKSRSYAELLDALYPLAANIRVVRRQGVGGLRRDGPPRQPGEVRRPARRAGARPALRRGRLRPQQAGRARLRGQDPARQRRRGAGQAGDGHRALQEPPLRLPHAGDGRRPHRPHAGRRPEVLRQPLHARPPHRRRRRRLPRGFRRDLRQALRGAARQGAAAAQAAAAPRSTRATSC